MRDALVARQQQTPPPDRTSRGARSNPRPRACTTRPSPSSSRMTSHRSLQDGWPVNAMPGERVAGARSTRRATRATSRSSARCPAGRAHVSSSGLPPAASTRSRSSASVAVGAACRASVRAASPQSGSISNRVPSDDGDRRAPDGSRGRRCGCVATIGDLVRELREELAACRGRPSAGRRGADARPAARRSPRPSPRPRCRSARRRRPAGARGRASSAAAAPRRRARPCSPSSARTACEDGVLPIPASPDQDAGSPPTHEGEDRPRPPCRGR